MAFDTWPDKCDYCGDWAAPDDKDPWFVLVCPGCERDGCPACMPAGRGCVCPECEDGDEDEVGDG